MAEAIVVDKVTKSYRTKKALNSVSFKVNSGSIFGFLGPNGAGKTTTIRCIMNFISVDSGKVSVLGNEVNLNSHKLRKRIGYLPAANNLYTHWTVREHFKFAAGVRNVAVDYSIARKLHLDIDAKVESLSTGNSQKLMIALAMIGKPELLILDEPTKGLDPILQNQLYELLVDHAKGGGTVFMSSHNLPEVEKVCDAIAVIKDGQIIVEETLESIRHKSIHEVSVIFKKPVPKDIFKGLDINVISQHDPSYELKVRGDLTPLLNVIHKHQISDLTIEHATLEEIFLEMYQ